MFLRKRAPGEPAAPRRPGLARTSRRSTIDGAEIPINRYFLQPPGDGAGHLEPQGPLYGRRLQRRRQRRPGRAAARPPSGRLPERRRLRRRQAARAEAAAVAFTPPPPERHIAEGSFFVGDDRVIRQVDGRAGRAGRLRRHAAQGRRHA